MVFYVDSSSFWGDVGSFDASQVQYALGRRFVLELVLC